MNDLVIGVDLGGTQIRTVLADRHGTIRKRCATLTHAHEGPEAVIERICQQIEQAAAGEPFAAIGIGAPGPTDPYQGIVLMGPNLPGWHQVNLRRILGDRFGAQVFVGNDANLAGLAEHRFGAGKGCRHMIYITVSTGIGGGVIIDNRLLLGRQGLAGEIGHITIDLQAEEKGEAAVGTLEGLASGPNIARRARHALLSGARSLVIERVHGDIASVSPRALNEAAQRGDDFARAQFRIAGRYLGVGITSLLHTFNPDRIVIGGSIWINCRAYMKDAMWEMIRQRSNSPEYWQDLEIVTAALGDDVGLLGAVALAADGLQQRST